MKGATTAAPTYPAAIELPGREGMIASLSDSIRDAVATGRHAALVLLDINGFAEVNAAWGVFAGDALLKAAGDRLQREVTKRCAELDFDATLVGRLDGDHFAVLLADIENWSSVREVAADLVRSMAQPYVIQEKTIAIGVRAAIVRIPEHASSVTSALGRGFRLLNNAARAKADGVALSERENIETVRSAALEKDLAQSLKTKEIFIVLQPKVATETGAVAGAEALVRWRHPSKGLLSPATFIGIAEKSGLIFDLGLRVLRDACRAAQFLELERRGLSIAVNVSAAQLARPDFLSQFLEVIDEEGVSPSTIAIEVTETAAMMGGESITDSLRSLRRCGLSVAIDDFGTGFSNLAALSTLQADTLKIDRSLVAHDEDDRKSAGLLGLTVQLAHTFGMETVAEGVETQAQFDRVRDIGCDYVQGYLTGKPVEVADFKDLYLGRAADSAETAA
jgi:diguanylate cyclase (GGDEF)-like protein